MAYKIKNSVIIEKDLQVQRINSTISTSFPTWQTSVSYTVNEVVEQSLKLYRCILNHTSSTFTTDLALNWVEVSKVAKLPERINTTATLSPGIYDIDSSTASFNITLTNEIGEWFFTNTNFSLDTNAVTLLSGGSKTFTNSLGLQTLGDFIANKGGKDFNVLHTELGNDYRINTDTEKQLSPVFRPNGGWDASTNTPDLTVNTNKVNGNDYYVYYVTTTGSQNLGNGVTVFEAGGRIEWYSNTVYNYVAPQSSTAYLQQTLTANGTVTDWGYTTIVNSATPVTITLPLVGISSIGETVVVKNIGAGLVTLIGNGADVLNGSITLSQNDSAIYEATALGVIHAISDKVSSITATTNQVVSNSITQTAHGFVAKDVIYNNGTTWVKALATAGTTIAQAVVSEVIDANTFKVCYFGELTLTAHGLTVGDYYYLDQTVAGTLTNTQPISGIVQAVLFAKDANTVLVDIGNAFAATSTVAQVALTYGRVRANLDLASTTHINTDPGTKIPFTISTYLSGMTDNAGSLIPSVSGRYRADWLCMAASTDFLADGIFHVVQNGVSVGQVSYNMNEASAVNQSAGFIDVNLVAGQEVSLNYRTRHTASDGIAWDRGSYFQLTQLPTVVAPVIDAVAEYGENNGIITGQTLSGSGITIFSDITGSSFILPSAGVWNINAVFSYVSTTGGGSRPNFVITDNSNNIVANTSSSAYQTSASFGNQLSLFARITTTGSTTYKIRWAADSANWTLYNATVGGTSTGFSKIWWDKIAGQLPSTGQTVDYISLVGETGDSFSTAPSFTLTSDIFPVITSVAPTTARLPFTTQTSGGTMTVTNSGNMTVGANNVTVVKTAVYSINASVLTARTATSNYSIQLIKNGTTVLSTSNGISGTSTTRDTQSINWAGSLTQGDTIDIRVKDGSSTTLGVARYSLVINQLGSSNAIVTDNAALFGEQSLTATTIGNATVDIINGSFTLPSAGTWEVEYFGNISLNAGNIAGGLLIADTSNVEVANSRSVTGAGGSGGGNESGMVSNKVRIITSAPTTYKIRGIGNSATIALSTGLAIGGVANKVTWKLIAGTVPSTGQTVDYVNARLTADATVASGAAIPYVTQTGNIPNAGGVFTLTAGKTYRLTAMVAYTGTQSTEAFISRWRDITNNVTLGADGSVFSTDFPTAVSASPVIEAVITPTTNIQVRVEHTDSGSRTFSGTASASGQNWATITQLGSSNLLTTNSQINATDGYTDIPGTNVRMQWGTLLFGTSGTPITLPAAFANTNYTVVVSSAAGINLFVTTGTKTTSNFICITLTNVGSPSNNNPISYYAIGQRP